MRDEGAVVRRRGLRPLLLPRLLQRRLRHAARAARSSSCSPTRASRWATCSSATATKYFISGEINSEVADQQAKMDEIEEKYGDGRGHRARRHLHRLRRLALQRAPVEHRAAAAPQPRVARLARGHGGQARRGARADPLVTRRCIHCLPIPTPFAGRAGQLLPDRGRPADAGRHRPELGQGARRARAGAGRARPHRSRTSS